MSVKVDLDQLADAMADYSFGYLITVSDDHHAHTIAVVPVLIDGVLDIGEPGKTTRRNVETHADVTVLWPPHDAGGYSLIVDGRGEPTENGMRVIPSHAVLHRPATPHTPATHSGCGHDCVPLEG